jgi:hypothetical protein
MNRWTVLYVTVLALVLLALGCSGNGNPIAPDNGVTDRVVSEGTSMQTHLWGYWDVYIDTVNQTVEAVPNRGTAFTANVVTFVNKPVTNLAFAIHGTPVGPDFIDVDIDVSITHPFPGIHQYDGYDVRGIFMGMGSGTMMYDGDLEYAVYGTDDQVMYDYDLGDDPDIGYEDPYDGLVGNPDGYTRWWNPLEFPIKGVLGYTDGALATKGYIVTSTLNPYKYFADGLTVEDEVFTWLEANAAEDYFDQGIFTAGATNTRNYYLRFPIATNVKYGYAIAADWAEHLAEEPAPPESHMVEAPAVSVAYNGDVYFVDASTNGGNFSADVMVWGWDYQPSTVTIETNVHSVPVVFDDTNAAPYGDYISTWSCDFSVDNVTALEDNEFWVIAEYGAFDYTTKYADYSVAGTYPEGPLAAFFRYALPTLDSIPCDGPDVTDLTPDTAYQGGTANAVATGTDFADGSMLNAWLSRAGQDDIVASVVTYVDATEVDFTFPIPADAELGLWDFNMTHDECPTSTTFDTIEILPPAFDIHFYDGSAIGDGIEPDPSNSGYPIAIDVACRPEDGAFYVAWGVDTNSNNGGWGYVDRYNAAGDTILMSDPCDPAGSDTIYFKYRRVGLDCNVDSGTSTSGWGATCDPCIHYGNNEAGTAGLNDSYGFWYGNPYWWAQDTCSPGAGHVYSFANFLYYGTHYRVPWEHGLSGNWDNATGNYTLQTPATDFDGAENTVNNPIWDDNIIALTMGSDRDSTFWNLHRNSPHVNKYTSWSWNAYAGVTFGNDGTGDGEIAASNFSGGDRITGPVDITTRDSSDRIYVLDEPTDGYFRIQAFEQDGTWLATSGEVSCATYGATEVYRFDYNEFEDCLYILLSDNVLIAFIDDSI